MKRFGWLMLFLLPVWTGPALSARQSSREFDRIPLHVLPASALEAVRRRVPPRAPHSPPLLALNAPLSLGLADGTWSEDGAAAVWRARLYSAGATLLIAKFDRFELPPGAELRFSDAGGTVVQGPYTRADRAPNGSLSTAMVPGEEAVLELRAPKSARDAVDLHLASLGHGVYRMTKDGVTPKSGSCNIDVVCPQGDGWRDQIRSVVRLQIPESSSTVVLCSGQMVNTTSQDDRPYILTANHCGITNGNVSSVVAYFNFQTSTCGGTPDGVMTQNRSGATLLFANSRSDHNLIRLNSAPPTGFNVYLSGFDATPGTAPQNGVTLHHPEGDEKRISVYSTPATRQTACLEPDILPDTNCSRGITIDAYRVVWSEGVTEGGSSGGGLWNQNERLVGVLSGGASSCLMPNGEDFFGRMDVAWDLGLKCFLDPTNTGARTFCGANPGSDCSAANPGAGYGAGECGVPGGVDSGSSGGGGGGSFGAGLLLLCAGLIRRVLMKQGQSG